MITTRYFNGYSRHGAQDAKTLGAGGDVLIEVWSADLNFANPGDRIRYFNDPGHAEHVMNIETDSVNGNNKIIVLFDGKPQNIIAPMDTVPTQEESLAFFNILING